MDSCANGGHPVLANGEAVAINALISRPGTTNSISSKKTALRVRLVLTFSTTSTCFFMPCLFRRDGYNAFGDCKGI